LPSSSKLRPFLKSPAEIILSPHTIVRKNSLVYYTTALIYRQEV